MRRVEQIMGTAISLEIAGPHAALFDDTFAWLREVDARFSTYRADSEISRLDRGELSLAGCSGDLRTVLDACDRRRAETGGYFDAYATGRLDPSGYVKGWAVQVASDRLTAAGATDHCLNAGGDIRLRGAPAPGATWRIGILNPWDTTKLAWILAATDTAVATSGTYERGAHVRDPHTGRPARELRSVTVVGPDLGLADAYATAALAMGPAALPWLAGLDGYESAVLTSDRRAFRSAGLPVAPEDASYAGTECRVAVGEF